MGDMAGISAAAGVVKAAGQYKQGKDQKALYDSNAAVLDRKATTVRQAAELNDQQSAAMAEQIFGQQTAGFAGAGVAVNTGTPLDVHIQSKTQSNLDRAIGRYNAEINAVSYENEAINTRAYGKDIKRKAKSLAFATLLETAGQYGSATGSF